eukprot:405741-Pelagomonas_calceolata.AAC.1
MQTVPLGRGPLLLFFKFASTYACVQARGPLLLFFKFASTYACVQASSCSAIATQHKDAS